MANPAGYSGTPLPKKLGLKDGQAVGFIDLPEGQQYLANSGAFRCVEQVPSAGGLVGYGFDFLHLFTKSAQVFRDVLGPLTGRLHPDGMIWVSWPKKASKVPSDMSEDIIRTHALDGILVDVKVCAVDEIWSGLKLMVRKTHRFAHEENRMKAS